MTATDGSHASGRSERPAAPDQADRNRIEGDLAETLFVEAGAGSGKTTALVGRVVALVCDEGERITDIAAITFTEKAAAELRDRIRTELEQRALDPGGPHRDRARQALADLDQAAIGTLHGFAQRLLTEQAVEAGLPPNPEVLDEVASGVEFDRRWAEFVDDLLEDPDAARPVVLALAGKVHLDDLRALARTFNDNWDLLADRLGAVPHQPPPLEPGPAVRVVAEALRDVQEILRSLGKDPSATMVRRLEEWSALQAHLEDCVDESEVMGELAESPNTKTGERTASGTPMKDRLDAACDQLAGMRQDALLAAATWLGHRIGRFVLESAAERRAAGRLEFHDLLVLARDMLRHPETGAEVRSQLARRYRRLLLDEFQDTDPIQIELAVLLACSETDVGDGTWDRLTVPGGRLFFVGDPKQSIYRFRRADIALFLAARARFGDGLTRLTANFRSATGVIGWVNALFGDLIRAVEGSQPAYEPLTPTRQDPPVGPTVTVIDGVRDRVDDVRRAEADDVVSVIRTAVDQGWSVGDGRAADGSERWRPAGLSDVCILLPTRTSLPFIQSALDRARIPYRTDSSTLVYAADEIRDLMAALRAVEDPTDGLALVTALRSPLYGCGDDDLARHKLEHRGSWNLLAPAPEAAPPEDPVVAAMAHLAELHHLRRHLSPAELLHRLIADRRVMEVAVEQGRHRDQWRRLRFVADQAEAWARTGDGTLRSYLSWVERQSSDSARVAESVLPETDQDAVRIMTVHAAKGLEFPVCVVAGLAAAPQRRLPKVAAAFTADGIAYRVGKDVEHEEFTAQAPIDEQMSHHERLRLLYVACTRAKDHLVVSCHRRSRRGAAEDEKLALAELVAARLEELADLDGWEVHRPDGAGSAPPVEDRAPDLPDHAAWRSGLDAALRSARRRSTVSATAVAAHDPDAVEDAAPEFLEDESRPAADPGLAKAARDLDLPPWQKGRYGTAVGRAVHAVLQIVDLASGDGLEGAVAAQAVAEGVIGMEDRITALVRSALESDLIRDAAGRPHWRELFVAAPVGDDLTLEGYLDLVVRHDDGLVVVDYKTDAVPDAATLEDKVERYRVQLAAYALALEQVLGEPVVRCELLFLAPEGAVRRTVEDLPGAVGEARRRAASLAAPG